MEREGGREEGREGGRKGTWGMINVKCSGLWEEGDGREEIHFT